VWWSLLVSVALGLLAASAIAGWGDGSGAAAALGHSADAGAKPDYVDRCPPPRGGDPGTDASGNGVLFFVANLDRTAGVKCDKARTVSGKYLRREGCADRCRLGRFECDHRHGATYVCGRASDGASIRFDIFDNGD
jgi:hypothetical protein